MQLRALFESASTALSRGLRALADPQGVISALQMHQVQAAVDVVLQLLRDKQQPLIEDALRAAASNGAGLTRSEEHTSELQSLMRISYDVFCLKKKTTTTYN